MIFLIFSITIGLVALSKIDAGYYELLGWRQKSAYLKTLTPRLFTINLWLYNLFFWSELIVMFMNPRKRALHDLMGGTVVVRDLYLKRLRLYATFTKTKQD